MLLKALCPHIDTDLTMMLLTTTHSPRGACITTHSSIGGNHHDILLLWCSTTLHTPTWNSTPYTIPPWCPWSIKVTFSFVVSLSPGPGLHEILCQNNKLRLWKELPWLFSCCCDKNNRAKATLREKGFVWFPLPDYSVVISEPVRVAGTESTWSIQASLVVSTLNAPRCLWLCSPKCL